MTMTDPNDSPPPTLDPIALAREVVRGRSLKRSESNQLLKELLALVEGNNATPIAPIAPVPSSESVHSPVRVQVTTQRKIFLGPEANRYYTSDEARALGNTLLLASMEIAE